MKKVFFSIVLSLIALPSFAQLKYIEGKDYQLLKTPAEEVKNPKVVDIFWFGCGHCEAIRKPVADWVKNKKPANVEFELMPAVTGGSDRWDRPAQAFYTMQVLGLDLFDNYFDTIFKNRSMGLLASDKEVKKYFLKNGVSEDKFDKAWNGFEVKQKLQRANKMFVATNADGVPLFIVNGKFVVTPQGSSDREMKITFDIIEFLLKQ